MILSSLLALVSLGADARLHCGRPPAPPEGESWLNGSDYPKAAGRAGMQGRVVSKLHLTNQGCPTRCETVQTSGFELLDYETCELLKARARFQPALDHAGQPIASTYDVTITWKLEP